MGRRGKSTKRTTGRSGSSDLPSLPRGCRGNRRRRGQRRAATTAYTVQQHDLNVPLPALSRKAADGGRRAASESRVSLVDRLRTTGYGVVAFTHAVYGRPDLDRDRAGMVLSDSAVAAALGGGGVGKTKKKRKRSGDDDNDGEGVEGRATVDGGGNGDDVTILRRLNVVIEELSDLAHYTETSTSGTDNRMSDLLNTYDIVSLAPRTDATFTAACATAHASDVIVLDYTAGRGAVQLPHKLRPSDVRTATERGAAFELNYAPAILDPAKRKALVRTAVDLRNACRGVREPNKPHIVLSSGSRVVSGNDHGPMALRAPGDLVNVLRTVLGFDDGVAADCLGGAAAHAVRRGRDRRLGRPFGVGVDRRGRGEGGTGGPSSSVSVYVEGGGGEDGIKPPVDGSILAAPAVGEMEGSLVRQQAVEGQNNAKDKEGPKRSTGTANAMGECIEDIPVEESTNKSSKVAADVLIDREEDASSEEDGFINLS